MIVSNTTCNMVRKVIAKDKKGYIIKYGIVKSLGFIFIALPVMQALSVYGLYNANQMFTINNIIKIILSIFAGVALGMSEYSMLCDTIEGKRIKDNMWKYVISSGILGWGALCGIVSITIYPFNIYSLISSLFFTIGCGLIIGLMVVKIFDDNTIKIIYDKIVLEGKNNKSKEAHRYRSATKKKKRK